MLYLDLEETPDIVGRHGMISDRRFSLSSFVPADHLFNNNDLSCQIRQLILETTGNVTTGRIRLLTQLRHFGYYFSPLNLFYISDSEDLRTEYVVAEVNNTPWGQRHVYLLWRGNQTEPDQLRFAHRKEMHVSPFMEMDMNYYWRLNSPGQRLTVHLENRKNDARLFSAGLSLKRRELSPRNLRAMSIRYPWMTAQIITAVHYQALKLWWKKCPVYQHPEKHPSLPIKPARNSLK